MARPRDRPRPGMGGTVVPIHGARDEHARRGAARDGRAGGRTCAEPGRCSSWRRTRGSRRPRQRAAGPAVRGPVGRRRGDRRRGVSADLVGALEDAKGFHQFLWSIRLTVARAETARLARRHDEAIQLAHAALEEAGRFGRRKYECLARTPLARALLSTGRAEEAADVATRGVVEAERLGHLPSRWPALAVLADAKAALGDDDAAADAHGAAVRNIEEFAAGLSEARRAALLARPDVVAARTS